MQKVVLNLQIEKRLAVIAWVSWFIVWSGVAVLIWMSPLPHNEGTLYQIITRQWWVGGSLYNGNYGVDGFLYLPQFVLVYSPFAYLDHPIGDLAWRRWVLDCLRPDCGDFRE